ncbi:hypothetical protein ACUNWD_16265 [Sunxiuqinia sp. A32]|uniref:hypothetical protein n=1 Tax=Sunxiuqinia sp. A32 TaxID=3461496 RepID=UPI004045CDC1
MKTIITVLLLLASYLNYAQTKATISKLNFELTDNASLDDYKNQACINTQRGAAKISDLIFEDGVIEFDMCVQEIRGFAGVRFRQRENSTEEFYIRMHQSGNPDAMQYTPVFNGIAGWQLYYGDGFSGAKEYPFDEWFHIKIAINGSQGEIYIENMEKPILVINELKISGAKGSIEFYGPARFANIMVSQVPPVLISEFKTKPLVEKETITKYGVSEPININPFIEPVDLDEEFVKSLNFTTLETESDGLANLARVAKRTNKKTAVIAQYKLNSDIDQVKMMSFGFSDAAKIYVNGQAIWTGMDNYRSRDYRFLGTIGYFDSVYMPLKKGENIITILVNESFGGWGFKAKLNNLDGISIEN